MVEMDMEEALSDRCMICHGTGWTVSRARWWSMKLTRRMCTDCGGIGIKPGILGAMAVAKIAEILLADSPAKVV